MEEQIAGYPVIRSLGPNGTLARGHNDRLVVLKPLPPTCMLNGKLHPNVVDRLGRVRELAHGNVANLLGVEADGQRAWLVWEYVEGQPLRELIANEPTAQRLSSIARDCRICIEAMHRLGIVHGALHDANVIVTPTHRLMLTHISPLLYNDPAEDEKALSTMFEGSKESVLQHDGGDGATSPVLHKRALVGATIATIVGIVVTIVIAWALQGS